MSTNTQKRFSLCLLALLLATVFINLLSAFIRHQEAGLGCPDWPDCYGFVGETITPPANETVAALTPAETAKRAHRAIATLLVILVLVVVHQARQQSLKGITTYLPYLIVAVILLLAVVGPASYLKTLPAIATVNLLGGMTLLALVWWLWLSIRITTPPEPVASLKTSATLVLVCLILQIALGAWQSANFAATACSGFLQCAQLLPATDHGFAYLRELVVQVDGKIRIDQGQVLIAQAHHIGAALVAVLLTLFSAISIRRGGLLGRWGVALLGLVAAQLLLGVTALGLQLPLVLVIAHNLIASVLLLCVIRMRLLT